MRRWRRGGRGGGGRGCLALLLVLLVLVVGAARGTGVVELGRSGVGGVDLRSRRVCRLLFVERRSVSWCVRGMDCCESEDTNA